jgi:hypothetical protein
MGNVLTPQATKPALNQLLGLTKAARTDEGTIFEISYLSSLACSLIQCQCIAGQVPGVPVTWEGEAQEVLEPRNPRPAWVNL